MGASTITRPEMTAAPALLTTEEVAAALRISRRTAQHLARHGRLPSVKVGGRIRFRQDEIEALLERARA